MDIALRRFRPRSNFGLCLLILLALTAIRLIGLRLSIVDLFYDESQYWAWSRELAFGYFSKPPLIAWVIAATSQICGGGESCLRAASPIFYFGTSLICYAIANVLYGERVAFWTALSVALATGVSFSARIITTDVLLLFFWSLALLAYVKLLRGGDLRWAITLGVAWGLGLLSKYTMLYFPLGMLLAAVIDHDARNLLRRPALWLALLFAVVLVAPNMIWNAMNDFHTFRHTGQNIRGSGLQFSISKGLAFLASPFGSIGPIIFAGFLVIVTRFGKPGIARDDRLMLAFAIPPLAIVTVVAFMRGANANWVAPSLISMVVVVVAILVRRDMWAWLKASIGIGLAVQAALLVGDAIADRVTVPMLGTKADLYSRTMGWRSLGTAAGLLARRVDAHTVVGENRIDVSSLLYYLRDEKQRVLFWPTSAASQNRFQQTDVLTAAAHEPILLMSYCEFPARLSQYYDSVTPLGPVDTPTGPTSSRRYFAFKLNKARGAIEPLGPCK
jgi:4-amino-4-deoxy-L-arabinose transferase-like glycosyltransferase